MIKIGIDARLALQTGNGTYIRNLIYFLQKFTTNNKYFYYVYLDKYASKRLIFYKKNFIIRELSTPKEFFLPNSKLLNQEKFLNILNKDSLDLMHFTHFIYPIGYKRKYIFTIHDITPLNYLTELRQNKINMIVNNKISYFTLFYHFLINNSSLIITPTRSVKKMVLSLYDNISNNKVIPIYEGVNYELIQINKKLSTDNNSYQNSLRLFKKKLYKRGIKDRFIIYVGNFYPHKNIYNLIYAYSKIKTDRQLVLIGPNYPYYLYVSKIISKLFSDQKEKNIVYYGKADNFDLVLFYKTAEGLISPSVSEGFGLPLVEAAYFNCRVIASDIEVFKEILGNQYLSFNPFKTDDLIDKLNYFFQTNPSFNNINILKKYSFEKMTDKILGLYEQILK